MARPTSVRRRSTSLVNKFIRFWWVKVCPASGNIRLTFLVIRFFVILHVLGTIVLRCRHVPGYHHCKAHRGLKKCWNHSGRTCGLMNGSHNEQDQGRQFWFSAFFNEPNKSESYVTNRVNFSFSESEENHVNTNKRDPGTSQVLFHFPCLFYVQFLSILTPN